MSISSSVVGDQESICGGDIGQEEKIFVTVRVRPLNDKEILKNEVSDWECINNTTIIFKTNMPERSMYPAAYTFDRVFGSESSTEEVYNEGVKDIALAAVSGINSSIFAYGQTSSGKTYTMSGITEYAVADIYEYMDKHKEREFVLKFSAMEIYNEAVRDLLSADPTPLRLLDDPERGTVVDRLIEERLEDWDHLQELLSICEDQRRIGETSLNETSSRSHQILRLTIESSAREYLVAGSSSTLVATVNFVDLAGSERASQALTAGARLKEGSHINRSLLTLGTVIRKLSKGRNAHIPYRDSKLTRILQNSLGGNAKTAIICTMSPARGHVEQSRNTLLFASCAKDVSTNAQVNVVMSDKVMVKQLQKELLKLEDQLRSMKTGTVRSDSAALREKDLLIEKMENEIKELTLQRDLAQSRYDDLLKLVEENRILRTDDLLAPMKSLREATGTKGTNMSKDFDELGMLIPSKQMPQSPGIPDDNYLLDKSTPKFPGPHPFQLWEEIAQANAKVSEVICKEVKCIKMEGSNANKKEKAGDSLPFSKEKEEKLAVTGAINEGSEPSTEEDEDLSYTGSEDTYEALKQKIQELHKTISQLAESHSSHQAVAPSSRGLTYTRSKSNGSVLLTIPSALWSGRENEAENTPHPIRLGRLGEEADEVETDAVTGNISKEIPQDSTKSPFVEEEEIIKEIHVERDDTTSVLDFVAGGNKMVALQAESQIGDVPVPESSIRGGSSRQSIREAGMGTLSQMSRQHHTNWPLKFERYRRKIIELWVRCNVPLVHRSYFFLLFKGDPSDNVYMEVELRKLYFLKDVFARGTNTVVDSQIVSQASSLKALTRERETLAKQLQKKFTKKEREDIYQKWGIKLDTKQRSLQLARRVWTDTRDMKHMKDSSVLVAKLAGLAEPRHTPKEMFGLSLSTPSMNRPSSWRDNMSSLL